MLDALSVEDTNFWLNAIDEAIKKSKPIKVEPKKYNRIILIKSNGKEVTSRYQLIQTIRDYFRDTSFSLSLKDAKEKVDLLKDGASLDFPLVETKTPLENENFMKELQEFNLNVHPYIS